MPARGPLQQILEANPNRVESRPTRVPEKEFLILFTARTGSSHLAELLTSAQVGDVREWLNPAFIKGQAEYWGATTFGDYFLRMRASCPRGVFGQKMTIGFYENFSREVRLEDYFNFNVPCVFLFREDIVEQSVSLCLANHRKVFHNTGSATEPLPHVAYNAAEIARGAEALCNEEDRLRAFVEAHGITPRYVSYEQFSSADPASVVEAVARLVGVPAQMRALSSRHQKLGDAENAEQAQRFISENTFFCDSLEARRQWLVEAFAAAPLLD